MRYQRALRNRLCRIEGQIRGVLQMMDRERECVDVITQCTAIRKALDRTIAAVVAETLEQRIRRQMEFGNETRDEVAAAIDLFVKSK
ncbi:metal-sensing transcriptional repressor [Alicyclobacillus sp. ALC3]|uniref:metal-sensing transcriptional repressor n=1 Tax=Alicyclobacillus sp. ALC3 TaxID=2796143 RepID=UPI002379C85E|nr:metal-sensing transcriptional repressor [Alicyclobacillus sp. ALC3]WDL96595.1 metal-sensing transcriptional repressor [Alicyclobacillus sp. ALC3]